MILILNISIMNSYDIDHDSNNYASDTAKQNQITFCITLNG
jgi:hypothetical protein